MVNLHMDSDDFHSFGIDQSGEEEFVINHGHCRSRAQDLALLTKCYGGDVIVSTCNDSSSFNEPLDNDTRVVSHTLELPPTCSNVTSYSSSSEPKIGAYSNTTVSLKQETLDSDDDSIDVDSEESKFQPESPAAGLSCVTNDSGQAAGSGQNAMLAQLPAMSAMDCTIGGSNSSMDSYILHAQVRNHTSNLRIRIKSQPSPPSPLVRKWKTSTGVSLGRKVYDTETFQCNYCEFYTQRWFTLLQHVVDAHTESDEVPRASSVLNGKYSDLQCAMCQKRFEEGEALEHHIFLVHGEDPMKCRICENEYKHPTLLQRHFRSHTEIRPFCCHLCKKSFTWVEEFRIHVNSVHSESHGKFKCKACGKQLADVRSLTKHQKLHSTTFDYECPKCGDKFHLKQHYNLHVRRHYKIKPFQCGLCGKEFTSKAECKSHARVHSDVRQFACQKCTNKFKTKPELKRHMLTHYEENYYECEICLFRLKTKPNLQTHIKKCHPVHALKEQALRNSEGLPAYPPGFKFEQ